jgi:5-dehydro-2-deoxygluconokinase
MNSPGRARTLDVITLGRAAVDLYGEQIGGRLEDMSSFAKYLGGCPANIAVGASRLGLKVGMITRVGDDHMGRFVRESLAAEGVDVSQVKTDLARLTALVILGIKDPETFPLIFYRENCADMALEVGDIDPAYVSGAQALVVTGTHFSSPNVDRASRAAVAAARAAGTKVVFDIDYRPVLWGLTGRGDGATRYVSSASVSEHLQSILPSCDLVVGTEEEIHIAGGSIDTLAALRRIRECSSAVIVVKRGSAGATICDGAIPKNLANAIDCPGFPVEVFNVLGAGDGFMAGLLAGWLRGKNWPEAGRLANACGALVVARHGCSPAMPTRVELDAFLARAADIKKPREDKELSHLHRVTTRRVDRAEVLALAFDHRRQFEELAERNGVGVDRIRRFKQLIADAIVELHCEVDALGGIVDERYGRAALDQLSGSGVWLARPVELPGSRPIAFEDTAGPAIALRAWPVDQIAKCLVIYDVSDPAPLREQQETALNSLQNAAIATGREWLLELISPGPGESADIALSMRRLYSVGLRPDWWKLPPSRVAHDWRRIGDVIRECDPYSRGVIMLGLESSDSQLAEAFAAAANEPVVRGFAVGRAIFWRVAERWFAGTISDTEAIREVVQSFLRVSALWRSARPVSQQMKASVF